MFYWAHWISSQQNAFVNQDVLYVAMTRFNVAMDAGHGVNILGGRTDKDWSSRRVEVFRRFCLPPMLKQIIKPQAWVILFDKDLTPSVAELFEELLDHDWIIPMLFGDDWARRYVKETREVFQRRFGHLEPKYVCCTRLDSDDSLNVRFHAVADAVISRLCKNWTAETSVCINFPFGALQYGDSLMIRLREKHFLALVEPFGTFRTPYQTAHTRLDQIGPVVDVFTEQPMYIYQRHGQNISGEAKYVTRHERFAEPERVVRYFGFQEMPRLPQT
jgi:Putative rhamnosyl transferase